MSKHKFAIISFLFAGVLLLFTSGVRAQETEIEQLIKDVSVDNQKGAISSYTYLLKFAFERHKGLAGRKFTRLYEAILPSRFVTNRVYSHQMLLLEDSERRLTAADIMNARKALAKELEKAESDAEKQAEPAQKYEDAGYWTAAFSSNARSVRVDVLKMLQSLQFSNLQRKKQDGIDVATLDFRPKEGSVFDASLSYLLRLEGRFVIDEKNKRVIRIEGFAPGEFDKQKDKPDAERQKELVFLFAQTKVAEGFWFPQTIWLNFGKHPEIFDTIEVQYNFSNYKKADVEIKETIDTPQGTGEPTTGEKQN